MSRDPMDPDINWLAAAEREEMRTERLTATGGTSWERRQAIREELNRGDYFDA